MKKKIIIISIILSIFIISFIIYKIFDKPVINEYKLMDNSYSSYKYVTSYEEYLKFKEENENNIFSEELTEDNFNGSYLLYTVTINGCGESLDNIQIKEDNNKYQIYFDASYSCGVCAPINHTYLYKVDEVNLEVEAYTKEVYRATCDSMVAYKPIIYIYPQSDMDLKIKLGNSNNLIYTYPKYNNEWNVHVSSDGNIYDYDTNRNYYGLYWEAYDNYELDMSTGFVVKGNDVVKFLEEKLEILGLNEYEINEFIIYWIDKLESNEYNFISFRSIDDINRTMPLIIDKEPDTLIRIMMDYKKLDKRIKVKEQELTKVERNGYTIVEWGGKIYN